MDPNLQQILSQQLRDVHLPEQLGWWPLAYGWWIVIVASLITIIVSIVCLVRHRRQNVYRKQALKQLQLSYSNWQDKQDTVAYLQSVNAILKRSILHIDNASSLVKTTGKPWVNGLNLLVKKPLLEKTQTALAIECYQTQSQTNVENIQADVMQWLKRHQKTMRGEHA